VALLEEAVRLADTRQDADLGFELREDLIWAATFGGFPEKSLVAFSWRLAQCDRDPERFSERDLLWQYKWIVASLPRFPQISRQQIENLLEDMKQRCLRQGAGMRSVHKVRWLVAMRMHDDAAARKHYAAWNRTRQDFNSDCPACDQDDRVDFQLFLGRDAKALELAQPILNGSLRCLEVPHCTLASLLLPLVRLGRAAEAMPLHHRGYRLIGNNPAFVEQAAEHLVFLALTDNLPKAIGLLEKHLSCALATANLKVRFTFFNVVRFLLERIAESGQATLRLRLPRDFPALEESGRYEVVPLRSWFDGACEDLAAQFDARNGNDGFTRLLDQPKKLRPWVTPCPLRPRRSQGKE
jgi:hypothetical protein